MRLAVPLAVLGVLGLARAAHASPSARLLYARSPDAATCPDEASLRKAVAARVGYDPFFAWATHSVIVQVWREPKGYAARVQVVDEQGLAQGTRELASDGDSCSELFDATALAISIALDATVPPPSNRSLALPPPPEPEPPPAPPMVVAEPPEPPRDDAQENGRHSRSRYWSVGADVMGGVGVAPTPNAGIEAFVARRLNAFSLEVGLRADMSFPKTLFSDSNTALGRAQSARFAVVVAPCAHLSVVYGCPVAQVGWVQAWISGPSHPQSPGGALVAAGARVGVDLPLSPSFDFRVYAEGIANLDRPVLVVDTATGWTAPLFAAAAGIGIGTVIP